MADESPPVIYAKKLPRFSVWPAFILGLVFFCVYGWNGLTVRHWDSVPVRLITAVLPIPAATVNGAVVTYHQLLKRRDALLWLQSETPEAVSKESLLVVAADALIRQQAMEQLAEEFDINVSHDDLNSVRQKLLGQMSDADFTSKIKKELNMTEAAFAETVLAPLALAQELESVVLWSTEMQKEQRSKIDQAASEIAAGVSFAEAAQMYSDDASAKSGGDIGYLTSITLPQGWDALFDTAEGMVTPVMETERALVIAKVAWLIDDAPDRQIRTQVILVKKKTLDQLVDEFLATSQIDRLVHFE